VQDPRYAVAIIVEHGGGGSHTAAPIARDILLEAQRLNPSAPRATRLPPAEFIPTNPANASSSTPAPTDDESD